MIADTCTILIVDIMQDFVIFEKRCRRRGVKCGLGNGIADGVVLLRAVGCNGMVKFSL